MAPLTSIGAPQPWLPPPQPPPVSYSNPNKKAASYNFCNIQPVCSLNCPQFCYYVYLPPPPPSPLLPEPSNPSSSSIHISSLLAAIIAALSTIFLVLFYFVALSPLLRHLRRRRSGEPTRPEIGLDENLIREMAVFKYRRGDGLIDGSDCAVCLSEFEDEEDLRLMPNCEHAFHVDCIDEWLKCQASCPLCRASMYELPPPPPPPVREGGGERVVAVADIRSTGEESAAVPELEEVIVVCHGVVEVEMEEEERRGEERNVVRKG